MASTLSDEELREKLEELGEKVGPITHTTRKVYEMKFDKAMQQRKTKRRSSNKLELSRFSSDENEMDGKGSKTSTSSTSSRRHIRPRRSIVSGRSQSTNDQVDSNAFKIPDIPTSRTLTNSNRSPSPSTYLSSDLTRTSVRSSRRLRRQKLNNFDIDSSDSDIDLDHHNRFKKKHVQSERTNLENNIDSSSHYNWDNSFYKTEKFDNNDKTEAQVSTGELSFTFPYFLSFNIVIDRIYELMCESGVSLAFLWQLPNVSYLLGYFFSYCDFFTDPK
ncbi:lamina-associated polypeptide 2-like [Centruroides sculpturatus]|uniref:lamina-associated polypeptide 2-like n=1 Tax=Centruroides sculpturatus TaxID=218467 RepID=UPI000C6E466F|nr:lamina-associated polypeptide 2-like [Centruroides sculpturatus]